MAGTSQWELSKENILPMKTGRDVNALNAALSDESAGWKDQRLREWRSFQDRIVASENNKEELLTSYYDLLCWLDNTFPQGGKKYIKMNAKRCFHKLKDDKSFYDNWKFMKVMIKYIEASGESCRYISENSYCDLFNFMYQNRIGTKHADFFIAWANALEASESYPQAATVFNKGLQMGAEPKQMLEKEKSLFEDRMALRTIEDMMREDAKLSNADRRQPLQSQAAVAQRAAVVPDEDSTVRLKKNAPDLDRSQNKSIGNARQSFSIHKPDSLSQEASTRPGLVNPAFTAVSAPSASNVVPIKHHPDKENSQKAEQWAKPTTIPSKPSMNSSSLKHKQNKDKTAISNSFQVYIDESDASADTANKQPVFLGQSILRQRKDDDGEEDDNILSKDKTTGDSSKASNAANADGNVKFMFNEDSVMSGPVGEMSFEELRANHISSTVAQPINNVAVPKLTSTNFKLAPAVDESMTGFLHRDEDYDVKHDNEADLTMALNAEVSRRIDRLSKVDAKMLGQAAFADSLMVPSSKEDASVLDDWNIAPGANETTEVERLSRDSDTSLLPCSGSSNGNGNKLSVTQFDCLNRILSEAFRGPSAAAPPFGISDESLSGDPASISNNSGNESTGFVPFQDTTVHESTKQAPSSAHASRNEMPKSDFFAYEDSFAQENTAHKRLALQSRTEDATCSQPARPMESSDFQLYEDSFACRDSAAPPKRLALQSREDKDATSGLIVVSDGDEDSSNRIVSDSPIQKRQRTTSSQQPSEPFNLLSDADGVVECSGIVADYCDDVVGGGRFSLSATIDFNNRGDQPKFCSTQYVDYPMQQGKGDNDDSQSSNFHMKDQSYPNYDNYQATSTNGANKRPPAMRRQSITARVSTMPPLQERSESSSSGGSTMGAFMHSVAVKDGLSAIWESNIDPPAPSAEDSVALPTMNCELQKSHHHIDVEKFVACSQLQQSVAFADKTYSCLREVDPTDPFSDELVELFVKKYEPSLKKLPNYIEVPSKVPTFSSRQSAAGKIIQLTPGYSMTYAFRVGNGAFASVVAAREIDTRRLLALKFQNPACKWEFYIVNELRQRLHRKTQLHCILDGIMEIERAFIYRDGSCYTIQHVRYGPLLNLVNKSREHKLELSEPVAAYITIDLLRMIEAVHNCHIIHADLKPDNILFLGLPELPKITRNSQGQSIVFPPRDASVRLIDWGRSIDMTLFPPGTAFLAKVATSGFDCIEMRTDRPWTYQADFFGLAGTIHVLIFLEYMRVSWQETSGRWWIEKKFKRWWHHNDLWESLFDKLLNIADCDHQPNIRELREAFEARFIDKMMLSYVTSQSSIMSTMKEHFPTN